MRSRTVHARFPASFLAELDAICAATGQSRSTIVRQTVEYFFDRPELWGELLPRHTQTPIVEDPRTPAQIEAWEQNKERLMHMDLTSLLRAPPPA